MTDLLIAPARDSGCEDLEALTEVVRTASEQQRSPVDDVLDSGTVDEEPYLAALADKTGMEWVASIPEFENVEPLRAACGPRVALAHRLLPMEITGEGGSLVLLTYDPLNLVARQAATQQIELPIVWKMASRRRIHDALRKLYGVGADTFEQILEGRDLDYDNLEAADEANVIDADEDEEASVVKFVMTTCVSVIASTACWWMSPCRTTSRRCKAR